VQKQKHDIAGKVLALELFSRMRVSVAVGIIGLVIIVSAHAATFPLRAYLPWLVAMLTVFLARVLFAHHALGALEEGRKEGPLVNREALLCGLTGLGWGSMVYVFDSGAMDQNFYLRLMTLAAAMSFVLSSMAIFVRIFLAYVGPIALVSVAFLGSAPYVEPRYTLALCSLFYALMLVSVAVVNNRRMRTAISDRLAVLGLTDELSRAQAVGHVGSWVYDIDADSLRLSDEGCRILGVPEGTVCNRDTYLALTYPQDRSTVQRAWEDAITGAAFDHEHRIVRGSKVRWIRQKAEFQHAMNGHALNAVGIVQDITKRKQMEYQLHQLAFSDGLTKLPNRRLTLDRLNQAMATGKRAGYYGALMIVDLDNFKPLNDTHGHKFGDLLLIEAAVRLVACLRKIDTVGRFGGDEFVVMLGELNVDQTESIAQASRVAEKVRLALADPYVLTVQHSDGTITTVEHYCTASIGVALFLGDEASSDDIIGWADSAMYQAKMGGRNSVQFHAPTDPA
jgi:diguanylate cyclase (GGDEF)-like protein/PAS domain S-box-containing protein